MFLSNCVTRFSSSLVYYGLSLNIHGFGLNLFLTQFIFGIIEIPANLSALVLNQHFGRRTCQSGYLLFGGAACLLIPAIPNGNLKTLDMVIHLFLNRGLNSSVDTCHIPVYVY